MSDRLSEIRARHARLTGPQGPVEFSDLDDVVEDVAWLLARVEALEAERAGLVTTMRYEAGASEALGYLDHAGGIAWAADLLTRMRR